MLPLTCLVWAVIVAAVAGVFDLMATKNAAKTVVVCLIAAVLQFVVGLVVTYIFLPPLVGTWWGYSVFLLIGCGVVFVTGCVAGGLDTIGKPYESSSRGWPLVISALCGVFLLGAVWCGTYLYVSASTKNAEINASFANVKTANEQEKMPKTDPDHIVLVTQPIAGYLGKQALASPGNNMLASVYTTVEQDYTLQAVKGHLYWIAPLVYARNWNCAGLGLQDVGVKGGFVVVDAEDPDAHVRIVQDKDLLYIPDMWFGYDLCRHAYSLGYCNGKLAEPTIEIDDNWKPYFTISYTLPQRCVRGDLVKKVLLVDPTDGSIQEFDPDKAPEWIDRVMYDDLVLANLAQWGKWGDERSRADWPQLLSAKYMMAPVEFELCYNSADKPVFLVPMKSWNNLACEGVVLYDSDKPEGTFYPGLAGITIGDNVKTAFEESASNLMKYRIGHLQLYSIKGVPTWVGIYEQPAGEQGKSFAAIGMVDAHNVQGKNVVIATSKQEVLAKYSSYLASAGTGNAGKVSMTGQPSKTVPGTVARIGWTIVGGTTVYTLKLEGDSHIYTATLKVRTDLPLVREGDQVIINYLDTEESTQSIISLKDAQLDEQLPVGVPAER